MPRHSSRLPENPSPYVAVRRGRRWRSLNHCSHEPTEGGLLRGQHSTDHAQSEEQLETTSKLVSCFLVAENLPIQAGVLAPRRPALCSLFPASPPQKRSHPQGSC